MDKFWNFAKEENESVDLYIKGTIESDDNWIKDWYGEQYTSENRFIGDLNNYKDKKVINIYINSPGGSVFAACSIYNYLKRMESKINCYVDGVAASAATIILMAADTIYMPSNSLLMIHDPTTTLIGNYKKEELESTTQALDKIKNAIIESYLSKVKISSDELNIMMSKETWLNANEAAEIGFADVILYNEKIEYENKNNRVFVNNFDFGELQIPFDFKGGIGKMNDNIGVPDPAKKERERLKKIDEIANNIDFELVKKAKYELNWDAEKLAYEAIKNNKLNNKNIFRNHVEANKLSGIDKVFPNTNNNVYDEKELDTSKQADVTSMFNFIAKSLERRGNK